MKGNKVVKNASWIISVRIVQAVLNMLISMITARYLGPSNFGLINYAASIMAFAAPIMNIGLPNILVQQIVVDPDKEGDIIGSSTLACIASGLICILGITAFVSIANHGERETIIICILYSFTLITQAMECITYWFQAKLMSKYTSLISLVAYILVSIYKIYLLVTGKSVRWFAIANMLDFLIISLICLYFYKRLGGKPLRFNIELLFQMVNKSKYYIISGLMISVFAQTDRIMLKLMIDESATGLYSAAVTCAGMTGFIFSAIIDSSRPAIFESLKTSKAAMEKNMTRLYSIVIYFALAQSIVITIMAKPIIYILYGSQYMTSAVALRVVVWYTTFSYLGAIRNIWMLATGKEKLIWIIDLSGAVANVFINILLIPRFGIIGASVASLITQLFANVIMGYILKPVRPNNRLMIKGLNPRCFIEMIKYIMPKSK